jgi:ankyrin repeat protein
VSSSISPGSRPFSPGPGTSTVIRGGADSTQREHDSKSLEAHYADCFEKANLDQKLKTIKTHEARLPNELVAHVLRLQCPADAILKAMRKVPGSLTSELRNPLSGDERGNLSPQRPLTPEEKIAYNDILNELHLAQYIGPTSMTVAQRGKLMHEALRLHLPGIFWKLVEGNPKDTAQAIHYQDAQGFNLLSKAILTRHRDIASDLVKQGVDVGQQDFHQSPVTLAALMGQTKLVDEILSTLGDKILPYEQDTLKFWAHQPELPVADREELNKIVQKGVLDKNAIIKLRKIAEDTQTADIEDDIKREIQDDLQFLINRTTKSGLKILARTQHAKVVELRNVPDSMAQGFQFDDPEETHNGAPQEQFKLGMASLAAGQDFHPRIAYPHGLLPMSRFGKVLMQCNSAEAGPEVISAAHVLIESGVDVNQNANRKHNPLTLIQNPEILDALLKAGADPKKLPEDTEPLLIRHFPKDQEADVDFAKKLIEAGADINTMDKDGVSPLLNACQMSSPDLALLLLKKGADPNLGKSDHGNKPLHWASRGNQVDLVKLMLEKGATVDEPSPKLGWTALHVAAHQGNLETAQTLLSHQADMELLDRKGRTPSDLAKVQLANVKDDMSRANLIKNILAATRYRAILKAIDAKERENAGKHAESES